MDLLELKLLILLMAANGAPILAHNLLGNRGNFPVDGGRLTASGQPWLGESKTWRGIIASLVLTLLIAALAHLPPTIGLLVGAGAMAGDLLSSFIKRRLGVTVSGMALGLDQIPEALLPLLLVSIWIPLQILQMIEIVLVFLILELLLSRILFTLNIRKKPY